MAVGSINNNQPVQVLDLVAVKRPDDTTVYEVPSVIPVKEKPQENKLLKALGWLAGLSGLALATLWGVGRRGNLKDAKLAIKAFKDRFPKGLEQELNKPGVFEDKKGNRRIETYFSRGAEIGEIFLGAFDKNPQSYGKPIRKHSIIKMEGIPKKNISSGTTVTSQKIYSVVNKDGDFLGLLRHNPFTHIRKGIWAVESYLFHKNKKTVKA